MNEQILIKANTLDAKIRATKLLIEEIEKEGLCFRCEYKGSYWGIPNRIKEQVREEFKVWIAEEEKQILAELREELSCLQKELDEL